MAGSGVPEMTDTDPVVFPPAISTLLHLFPDWRITRSGGKVTFSVSWSYGSAAAGPTIRKKKKSPAQKRRDAARMDRWLTRRNTADVSSSTDQHMTPALPPDSDTGPEPKDATLMPTPALPPDIVSEPTPTIPVSNSYDILQTSDPTAEPKPESLPTSPKKKKRKRNRTKTTITPPPTPSESETKLALAVSGDGVANLVKLDLRNKQYFHYDSFDATTPCCAVSADLFRSRHFNTARTPSCRELYDKLYLSWIEDDNDTITELLGTHPSLTDGPPSRLHYN